MPANHPARVFSYTLSRQPELAGNFFTMPHTTEELVAEFEHVKETRLAILCGDAKPTPEQLKIATDEARETVKRMKGQ